MGRFDPLSRLLQRCVRDQTFAWKVSCAPRFGELIGGLMSPGPLARTVEDAAGVLDVLSGYVTGDPPRTPAPERSLIEEVGCDPGRLRVGMVASSPLGEVPPIAWRRSRTRRVSSRSWVILSRRSTSSSRKI